MGKSDSQTRVGDAERSQARSQAVRLCLFRLEQDAEADYSITVRKGLLSERSLHIDRGTNRHFQRSAYSFCFADFILEYRSLL
jgi:hypothetical protein